MANKLETFFELHFNNINNDTIVSNFKQIRQNYNSSMVSKI